MSSVDERVVQMKFENDTFKKKAAETKGVLNDVNKSVDAAGKSKGLLDMNSNMQKVQVTASKMSVVVTTALATITNKAVNAGISMVKSLTFDPIRQGFSEYESMLTKQNVIQNATGKSAKYVKGILNELNTYSDKTIYSFGNMTDAVTKFVNAGVPLNKATVSIKGIANAAAFAGASSAEADRAMYAFSQSMSLGFIQLQDWNQIENANMGTVKFKNTLLEAGVAAGTLTKRGKEYITAAGHSVTATKGWRDGLQDQWATTQVLNTALGKYADTSTKLGKKAFEAATQVRTFSAFMDTLKEGLGSGWSQIFTALIGGLGQSTKLWTGLSNAVGNVANQFFSFATKTLKVWRNMGGFEKVLGGIKNILAPIGALFSTIGKAWREAFPNSGKGAGKTLYAISSGFEAITSPLQLVADLIRTLATPLATVFGLFRIGGAAIKGIIGYVTDFVTGLLGVVHLKAPSSGGFLGFIKDIGGAISDAVRQITTLLDKGKSLKEAFGKINIKLPSLPSMPKFGGAGDAAAGAGAQASAAGSGISALAASIVNLDGAKKTLDDVGNGVSSAGDKVQSVTVKMGDILSALGSKIKDFASKINMKDVMSSFNLAVLSTFMLSFSRMLNAFGKSFEGFAGIGPAVTETIKSAGDSLGGFAKAAQRQAMAKIIINLAIAVGILAAALWVLSKIPADKLATSLGAMAGVFVMLNLTMKNLTKLIDAMDGKGTTIKIIALSVAIVALGAAMILLATACLIMNKVKWDSIAKGLITMYTAMKLMETLGNMGKDAAKNMVSGAIAIGLVAASMMVLAGALLMFKLVDWGSMAKAGTALAGVALAVGLLALIPYEGIAKVGAALLIASVGMLAMANALIMFALVKWGSIGKAAVVLGLLTIALAALMFVGGPVAVSGMVSMAAAMVGLALACLIFNKVDWSSIGKAAVVLTLLLAAVAIGAVIMTAFLYAIAPVSPVLIILAAGFALLGVGLLAFSAAMAIAMGLAAAGTAAFAALATGAAVAIAVFLQTLAMQAPIMKDSFLQILQTLIDTIVEAVPMVIKGIKDLWNAVKKEITGGDKKQAMAEGGKSWVDKLKEGINKQLPKIVAAAADLAVKFINGLAKRAGDLATAGLTFIKAVLDGMAKKIPMVVDSATNLIIKFIQALGKNGAKLAAAGIQTIATFLHDLADAIRAGSGAIGGGLADVASAFGTVGLHMVEGLAGGIGDAAHLAIDAAKRLAESLPGWVKKVLGIHSPSRVFMQIGKFLVLGMTAGIQNNAASAISAVASMVSGQIATANEYVNRFIQNLDQQTVAAQGRAQGLRAAAEAAAKSADRQARAAEKTKKDKKDDHAARRAQKAADRLGRQADKADKAANAAAKKAEAAKAAQDRRDKFNSESYLGKAQMKSEDAQNQLDAAKAAETRAAKDRQAALALEKQAKNKNLTAKERKALEKQAADLRQQARDEAKRANQLLTAARGSATEALGYQTKAGKEAADAFQAQFDAEAKAAEDADKFEKMSDAEKAKKRRQDAADLEKKAAEDLKKAKELAYTDLEGANALAQQAMAEADQARQFIDDAIGYEQNGGTTGTGTVVNLEPSDAAAMAFNQYSQLYDSATAAAAAAPTYEFNQYNSSPETLDAATVYRQSNNLFTFAADSVSPAA